MERVEKLKDTGKITCYSIEIAVTLFYCTK